MQTPLASAWHHVSIGEQSDEADHGQLKRWAATDARITD